MTKNKSIGDIKKYTTVRLITFIVGVLLVNFLYTMMRWDLSSIVDNSKISETITSMSLPVQVEGLMTNDNLFDKGEIDTYLKNKRPTPRDVEERRKRVIFVHVGKAGGSSILREAWPNSIRRCKQYKRQKNQAAMKNISSSLLHVDGTATDKYKYLTTQDPGVIHPCIIAARFEIHIHMGRYQEKYHLREHYVVPVRNPVNRLISWYNYEIGAQIRNPDGSKNIFLEKLWKECYPTVGELLSDGLVDDTISSTYDRNVFPSVEDLLRTGLEPYQDDNYRFTNGTKPNDKIVVVGEDPVVELSCRQIATECVTGRVPCFGHNFYNNEVYLEDLLLWKEICSLKGSPFNTANTTTTSTSTSTSTNTNIDDDDNGSNTNNDNINNDTDPLANQILDGTGTAELHKYGPPHDTLDCSERRHMRIDVIRTEHVALDLNRTTELWTGVPLQNLEDIGYTVRNTASSHNGTTPQSTFVPQRAITKLCKQICMELIVYKKILFYADNLYGQDVIDSWNELDTRCNMDVDQVCGTKFVYRSIKRRKNIIQ